MNGDTYISKYARLHVKGVIWQGSRASHDYPLDFEAAKWPKNLAQAKAIAGDFSELTSAKIVFTERHIVEMVTTKRLK